MGLVTQVVAPGRHLERALEIAEGLARFPQPKMLADRRAAIEGLDLTLDSGLALEARSARLRSRPPGAGQRGSRPGRGAAGRARGCRHQSLRAWPWSRSQRSRCRQSGQRVARSDQKRGEWSGISRCATSCSTT